MKIYQNFKHFLILTLIGLTVLSCSNDDNGGSVPTGENIVEIAMANPNLSTLVEALEITARAHRQSRTEFRLPPVPPDDPEGVRCNLCVNACRIGENEPGYCGLRENRDGRLTGGSAAKARLSLYHDPLPTNCVADWVCAGGTKAGYPTYSHCPGAESGYKNLAVFFQA